MAAVAATSPSPTFCHPRLTSSSRPCPGRHQRRQTPYALDIPIALRLGAELGFEAQHGAIVKTE